MPNININNEGGELKPPVKKVLKKKVAKNPEASLKTSSDKRSEKNTKSKGGILFILAVIGITSVVVGSGSYAWQKKYTAMSIENIQKSARTTRMDFENRIASLKEKVDGFESEKSGLVTENEELKKKAELINMAKINFVDDSLGLSFDYPARFGKLNINVTDKEDGKVIRGDFSDNDKFVFGCVSNNLPKNENAQKLSFLDTRGFLEEKDEYYFLPQGEESKDHKLNPAKIINFSGGKALLVDKKSFSVNPDKEEVDIGENVGVIINLKSETCKGLAFMNSDFGVLPLDEFIKIIESIKLK